MRARIKPFSGYGGAHAINKGVEAFKRQFRAKKKKYSNDNPDRDRWGVLGSGRWPG